MVCLDAVNAAGPIGPGRNVIQVCSNHTGAAGIRAIDLGGGIEEALVGRLLTSQGRGDSGRKVDVTFLRLIHLGLVGEQDLWL